MSVFETDVRSSLTVNLLDVRKFASTKISEKAVIWSLLVSWLLACLPLLFVRILPSVDYPNHLARAYILARGLSLPGYAHFYHAQWTLLPNLAFDLAVVSMAKIMPVAAAGRVFLAIVFGLTIYGGARLNRAFTGQWTWLALMPALLIYNRILAYGFINFLFGLGLIMLALAFHIEQRESRPTKRLATESIFLIGLFASHLVALALYVFCALAYDIWAWMSTRPGLRSILRDLAVLVGPFIGLMAVFLAASPTTAEASQAEFRPFILRIKLLHETVQTGQGYWDTLFGGLLIGLVAWMLVARKARFTPAMAVPLLGLLAGFLVCPTGFQRAMNVDTRIPLVLTILAFAALVPRPGLNQRHLAACVLGLLGFRAVTTSIHYRDSGEATESVLADLRLVPEGSVLLVARHVDSQAFDAVAWNPPLMHLGCLLLLERPVLEEDLFTIPTQQPLLKNAPYDRIDVTSMVGGTRARNMFDFGREAVADTLDLRLQDRPVYIYYVKEPGSVQTPPMLKPVVLRERYAIYRVDPSVKATDKVSVPRTMEKQPWVRDLELGNGAN